MPANFEHIARLAKEEIDALVKADESYGDSWKSRGGVGAFMMLARKWDRIENQVTAASYDVFEAVERDPSPTGILDDIHDLRRYLLLVESEARRLMGSEFNAEHEGDASEAYVDQD